jgi:exopolysaccharide biosynthesis WecB/TagA/CpsF family protein
MIDLGRYSILGIKINAVDYEAAIERVIVAARSARPLSVSALAVHGVMTGVLDRAHRHRLKAIDLLVPDGQPVRWALRWLHGAKLPDRVYGPSLMMRLCQRAAAEELPIFLFGGSEELLKTLRVRLRRMVPGLQIAGCQASRFRALTADEQHELVEKIRATEAKIVFVGIGCPRQEVFVYEIRNSLSMPLLAVGAAFAFHAAFVPQASPLLQRAGLEWLFRLISEPTRLWRRYLFLNPLYLLLVALQAIRLYKIDPADTLVPQTELRFG